MKRHERPIDNELLVFISKRSSSCGECGSELGRGAWIRLVGEKGALCLSCADLDHLEFLPAEKWKKEFRRTLGGQYPKAVEILDKDWQALVAYYAFPKEHWKHLRTTDIIESPFAAVRLRTSAAKRFKRVDNATAMIWRLVLAAEKTFRKLNAPELCGAVYRGALFRAEVSQFVNVGTVKRMAAFPRSNDRSGRCSTHWESRDVQNHC